MKPIQQVMQQPITYDQPQQSRQQSHQQAHEPSNAAKLVIDQVFKSFQSMFSSSFSFTFKTPQDLSAAKCMWEQALIENNITTFEGVRRGMVKARSIGGDYIPSIPKFIQWCLDDDSFERYIKREELTDLAERATASEVGWQCRTQLESSKAKTLWNKTLARYRADAACGKLKQVEKEKRIAPETTTANHTQEQKDSKTLKSINDLIAQGYPPRGALKRAAIEWGIVNPDGSIKE